MVGPCPKLVTVRVGQLMRLIFKGLRQRVHLAQKLRHLLREALMALSLASTKSIRRLRSAPRSASFSLRRVSSSRSEHTVESSDTMVCSNPSINDELLMINDELDVVIVPQCLRFHRAEGLHGEVVRDALALVALIERFKLFPYRYCRTFGIVQTSLTLLSLNAIFLIS